MIYELDNNKITADGHTMFPEDIVDRLNRLTFLENYKRNLIKVIDKHFWNWEDHHYECDGDFLEDLDKLGEGKFVPCTKDEEVKE